MRCKVFEPFSIKSLHLYRKQRNQNWFYNTFLTLFSIKLIRNKPFYRFLILICSPPENKDFLSRHYVKQLRHALADAKIPFDRKKFHPHITLLRNAQSRYDFKNIAVYKASMTVQKISLMRSDFGKHGAVYTEIGSVEASK